mmetsp:Transcript_7889/g.26012  ORF Transcript_7889/g.26012 Transcript_7889/m.26012 type:complete len:236 (-) Transcript_7889:597-1304(-)
MACKGTKRGHQTRPDRRQVAGASAQGRQISPTLRLSLHHMTHEAELVDNQFARSRTVNCGSLGRNDESVDARGRGGAALVADRLHPPVISPASVDRPKWVHRRQGAISGPSFPSGNRHSPARSRRPCSSQKGLARRWARRAAHRRAAAAASLPPWRSAAACVPPAASLRPPEAPPPPPGPRRRPAPRRAARIRSRCGPPARRARPACAVPSARCPRALRERRSARARWCRPACRR